MIYADTSFFTSLEIQDQNSGKALAFYEAHFGEDYIWTPLHRVEIFNTLRQSVLAGMATLAGARAAIRSLEQDVRAGYFVHREKDWRSVLQRAESLSQNYAFRLRCRMVDLLHVAYAAELKATEFVTFDRDQVALAKAAGLKTAYLG
jgi:predicted nucleic acid-binding protein